MSNNLTIEFLDGVRIIKFTNAEQRNALSREVLDELHLILDHARESVVFTGTGNVFASGANLNEIAAVTPEQAPEFARYGQSLMNKIEALPYPTLAAVNGFCFGGALDLALACKHRIASPDAAFAHPGAGLGIITGWGGTQRLPRLVGKANALEMFFTASPVGAERALAIGLVDEIAVDPVSAAMRSIPQLS